MFRLRERARALWQERWQRRLLIAWLSFGFFEALLSVGNLERPSLAQALLEVVVAGLVGVLHVRFGRDDWRGSAAWPFFVGTTVVVSRMTSVMFALALENVQPYVPLIVLGMLGISWFSVRVLDRILWRRIPAVVLSLAGPLLLRLAVVGSGQTVQPFVQWGAPAAGDGPPVVIITIDTLRADSAATMESFKRMADRGGSWAAATAPSSWTWPSLVTLLSGVEADEHGSGRKETLALGLVPRSDELPLLPDELREKGYWSAAFVSNPILPLMNLRNSFDEWWWGNVIGVPFAFAGFAGPTHDGGDAEVVVDRAIAWLEDAPERGYFLWVHLYDPHLPYLHTPEHRYDYNLLRAARTGDWFVSPEERRVVRAAYDKEVQHADENVVRLLTALEEKGALERGVVVLTSDHGEEFWEHGGFEHGHSHHGEVINIPLAVVAPSMNVAKREDLASLVDVAPTIRAVVGLEPRGLDLREPIDQERMARAFGNLYFGPMRSVRTDELRWIAGYGLVRRYDLARDPEEQHPEIVSNEALTRMEGEREPGSASPSAEQVEMDLDLFRALGYVH